MEHLRFHRGNQSTNKVIQVIHFSWVGGGISSVSCIRQRCFGHSQIDEVWPFGHFGLCRSMDMSHLTFSRPFSTEKLAACKPATLDGFNLVLRQHHCLRGLLRARPACVEQPHGCRSPPPELRSSQAIALMSRDDLQWFVTPRC